MAEYTCEQVRQRLQDYLDRELSSEETELVCAHLEWCAWCVAEMRFEAGVLREIRAHVSRIAVPPCLLQKVLASIDAALERR